MKITIHADEFARGMDKACEEYERRIQIAVQRSLRALADDAKQRVVKRGTHISAEGVDDGGPLRDSIDIQMNQGNANGKAGGVVFSSATYAAYYHEGTGIYSRTGMGRTNVPWSYKDGLGTWHTTSGMQAHPFLEEAADASREEIARIFYAYLTQGGNG